VLRKFEERNVWLRRSLEALVVEEAFDVTGRIL
jgi:hypothetical protein